MKRKHVIPRPLAGIATLLMEYVSLRSEETELLMVLLTLLILVALFDVGGTLGTVLLAALVLVTGVVLLTLLYVIYKRRMIEEELWRELDEGND